MKVEVFTDGACSKNGQNGARASWACWFPEHKDLSKAEHVPTEQLQTNQRGELMAIHEAVKLVESKFPPSEVELKIYTDSMYCKNCLTQWLPNWVKNNWKNSQGNDVAHRDLIEDCANRMSRFNSYIVSYVKAHTNGDSYESVNNDIVDKMAVNVLHPVIEKPHISSNQEEAIAGLPLMLMGPPVSSKILVEWCKQNLDKLDKNHLETCLISALSKTVKKKGFEVVKQRLHRTNMYRLKTDKGLISENTSIVSDEE